MNLVTNNNLMITVCSNDFESSGSEAEINDEQYGRWTNWATYWFSSQNYKENDLTSLSNILKNYKKKPRKLFKTIGLRNHPLSYLVPISVQKEQSKPCNNCNPFSKNMETCSFDLFLPMIIIILFINCIIFLCFYKTWSLLCNVTKN